MPFSSELSWSFTKIVSPLAVDCPSIMGVPERVIFAVVATFTGENRAFVSVKGGIQYEPVSFVTNLAECVWYTS